MILNYRFVAVAGLTVSLMAGSGANAGLVNPGFEYGQAVGTYSDHNDASINPAYGWYTSEADHQIEVWGNGFHGVPAYEGDNFVELNANAVGTLYQTIVGIQTGDTVDYHFAHRGRAGVDTMELDITDVTTGGTTLFSQQYSDGTSAWGYYSGSFTLGAGVAATDTIKFAYISISSVGGPTVGNFLDDADFGIGVNGTAQDMPEPMTIGLLGFGLAGIAAARRRVTR